MGREGLVGQGIETRKGQQPILIGGIYRGSEQHVSLRAGGNDEAQITVTKSGVVTTGKKYVLCHAAHVSIRIVAVTWHDLPPVPETADDDSEAQNYCQPRNQHDDQNADFSVDSNE